MPAASINFPSPVDVPDALTLVLTVPAGEEWSLDARVTNILSVVHLYTLARGPTDVPVTKYRLFNFKIPAGEPRDVEEKLILPSGTRLYHRGSLVGALQVDFTGRIRYV